MSGYPIISYHWGMMIDVSLYFRVGHIRAPGQVVSSSKTWNISAFLPCSDKVTHDQRAGNGCKIQFKSGSYTQKTQDHLVKVEFLQDSVRLRKERWICGYTQSLTELDNMQSHAPGTASAHMSLGECLGYCFT